MKVLIFVSLLALTTHSYAANLNCTITAQIDLSDIVGDDEDPIVIEAKAQLKTKKSRVEGQIVGTLKAQLGDQKAKYKCGGTETPTALDIYCIPQPAADFGDESALLIKLNKISEKNWTGTSYVNDGDNETEINTVCESQ